MAFLITLNPEEPVEFQISTYPSKIMDPLVLAATAIAATIMTKFLERTGEELSEKLFDASENLFKTIRRKSPEIAKTIEKASPDPSEEIETAVLQIESLLRNDEELEKLINILMTIITEENDSAISSSIQFFTKNIIAKNKTFDQAGENYLLNTSQELLLHDTHKKYLITIKLSGCMEDAIERTNTILKVLREESGDENITIVTIKSGSIFLVVSTNSSGAKRLYQRYQHGALKDIAGFLIERVNVKIEGNNEFSIQILRDLQEQGYSWISLEDIKNVIEEGINQSQQEIRKNILGLLKPDEVEYLYRRLASDNSFEEIDEHDHKLLDETAQKIFRFINQDLD